MDIIFVEPEETDQTVQIGAYIYRKNSGEDINITSLTFKNSLLAARTLMVPENYMICILRNGERVRRWDREILAGSN
ncbi:type IV pilus biogenesis protein PilI, partial [Escherichia coli]